MTAHRWRVLGLSALTTTLLACGHHARRVAAAPRLYHLSAPVVWPPLPTTGYIKDRVAMAGDVTAGDAVFAACVGKAGHPLHVAIPQYALWRDSATGTVKPVIVVEAELFDGDSMFGLRQIPGGTSAMARVSDLELLGRTPPSAATPKA